MKRLITFVLSILLVFEIFVQNQSLKPYDMNKGTQVNIEYLKIEAGIGSIFSDINLTSAIVIGEIVILVFVLYYWKKTKDENKQGYKNNLKNNIRALREERVRITNSNGNRKKIIINKLNLKLVDSTTISNTAKKLSISKGEIFLAQRMKQMQDQYK